MCKDFKVYALSYVNTDCQTVEDWDYYSSKEKAEKMKSKILRIQKLSEELDRRFEDYNLHTLINHSENFYIRELNIK